MKPRSHFLFVAIVVGFVSTTAMAGVFSSPPKSSIPMSAIPTVKCVRELLKSSSAVQSVSLYSVDGFRFSVEYVFRDKKGQFVFSDIEMYALPGKTSIFESDKVPREISEETMSEADDLELGLDLFTKCNLDNHSFDNLIPQPAARADWRRIDWPN
jgi:hypothetical protein